jgi:DNA-binding NtrC family response regulator
MSDSSASDKDRGNIIALVPDVFFSVTVRNTIRRIGHHAHMVKTAADLSDAVVTEDVALVVVDLAAMRDESDWDEVTSLAERDVPVLVFGAHRDVDGLRRAKAAGVTRVVANSQFHREMPVLIERYVRASNAEADIEDIEEDASAIGSTPPGMSGEQYHERASGSPAPE